MQPGYKLNTGIKTVFSTNGTNTLCSIILANILADYGAYEEYPATKIILRDLLSNDFGVKIYNTFNSNTQDARKAIDDIRIDFQKNTSYKDDFVKYVFDSISYGLGLITDIEEPITNSLDPFENESDDILDRLPEMLASLKKEYDEALRVFLVKPKDIIWDAPAYYPIPADNKLYLILGKIEVISNQLGTSDYDIYKKKKNQILLQNKEHKIQAVKECIEFKKDEFKKIVSNALVKPSSSFIGKSAYISSDKLFDLEKAEKEIVDLYKEAGITYDSWCKMYNDFILAPFLVSTAKKFRQIALKIIIPIIIVCSGGYFGITYYFSQDDLKIYKSEIENADQFVSEQLYGKAIAEYRKAGEKYNAPFITSYYKSEALDKSNECFNLMKIEINSLLQNKKYAEIIGILDSLPDDYISSNQENKEWAEKTKIDVKNSVNQEVDSFADKISQNNGKLSQEDKNYLKKLLSISPDNYWLKLIWNREK